MKRLALIVTGDRHATLDVWWNVLESTLTQTGEDAGHIVLIHGDARGIDRMAGGYALDRVDWHTVPMPAQWGLHGKAAGPRRNGVMLRMLLALQEHGYMAMVLAFHDDIANSKGTKHMVEIARRAKVPVVVVRSGGPEEAA